MTHDQIAAAVTRIYTAAGRRVGQVDLETWFETLEDVRVTDQELSAVTRLFIGNTPRDELIDIAHFKSTLKALIKRRNEARSETHGLGEAAPTSPEQAKANLMKLKEAMSTIGQKA